MISDNNTAKQVSDLMLKVFGELEGSLDAVKGASSPEEYTQYRKAVGKIACRIVFDVLEPLYDQHPELKPPKWDDWSTDVGA